MYLKFKKINNVFFTHTIVFIIVCVLNIFILINHFYITILNNLTNEILIMIILLGYFTMIKNFNFIQNYDNKNFKLLYCANLLCIIVIFIVSYYLKNIYLSYLIFLLYGVFFILLIIINKNFGFKKLVIEKKEIFCKNTIKWIIYYLFLFFILFSLFYSIKNVSYISEFDLLTFIVYIIFLTKEIFQKEKIKLLINESYICFLGFFFFNKFNNFYLQIIFYAFLIVFNISTNKITKAIINMKR